MATRIIVCWRWKGIYASHSLHSMEEAIQWEQKRIPLGATDVTIQEETFDEFVDTDAG